jgi:ATP-binding cassette subfamily B protein/subfamily B ATP-binding cassette protein MsbA
MIVCSLMVVLHILAGGIGYVTSIITLRVGLHAILRMRTELYAYLHSLPLKFHDERRSSDSSFRVAYDSQSIQSIYSRWFFVFQSTITLGATFATMWAFDYQIALLSLLVVPFMVLAIYLYAKRIREQSTQIAEQESAVLTAAQEGLSSVKMVQAFGREDHEVGQFRVRAHGSLEANLDEKLPARRHAHRGEQRGDVLRRRAARHAGHAHHRADMVSQHAAAHALPAPRGAHAHRVGPARGGFRSAALLRGVGSRERRARRARRV